MAYIELYPKKLAHNYSMLDTMFKEHDIDWAVVSKMLCGNSLFINEVVRLGPTELCDSRISNLKKIKKSFPQIQTVYIKPPAKRSIKSIVEWADVSFNTEFQTLKWLSDEAVRQNKVHKVLIMIELGDLREGVMGEDLMGFYAQAFKLPNINIVGIGANLNCLNGVMPSVDKLIQLSLYKQLIEAKFQVKMPWVSGGTSVVIPLVERQLIPKGINHFRVGETLFFGVDLFKEGPMTGLHTDVFKLFAEIIEITEKPIVPNGELAANPSGEVFEIDENDYGKTSKRAIIDVGLLDIQPNFLETEDPNIEIEGASSDMLIMDLKDNKSNYKVGDLISFNPKYMGVLGLMNSNYIEKRVATD